MKRKFLNIISCFLALFIFVGSFVFYVPSHVSADVSVFPSDYTIINNQDTYIQYYNLLKSNPSFPDYDCYVLLGISQTVDVIIISQDFDATYNVYDGYFGTNIDIFCGSVFHGSIPVDQLSSYNIIMSNYNGSDLTQWRVGYRSNMASSRLKFFGVLFDSSNSSILDRKRDYYAIFNFIAPAFTPDYSLTGVVVGFDFSVEAFTQWLIDTEKYKELPSYIGTQKLKSFVQFYHDWGSSNSIFIIRLVEWFMHFNIASQTIENRNIIKSTIDRLYQEYKNSAFVQINHDSSILPHHRKNIETNTTDDDLILVTDDPNDDTLISILRDILRGVISIPNSIFDNTQAILAKLDQLNHNIIISNNGGASSGSDLTPVLDKMDDIIEALGADTVSVEIDQTTKDDTDDFFDDWNLEFKTALDSKFPVASQLNQFFTGFFERCGIDADSDGEVYQYYNPGVLTASSVSRSAGTASEDDIVSDFLGKFDNSDPSFLDDASFHGVPDLSVSVGGQSVSIIDFRVYAKYREKIHFIISFVIWTLYLLHLYKALPQIIGQVADVAVKSSDL